jgi:hypothetical protein
LVFLSFFFFALDVRSLSAIKKWHSGISLRTSHQWLPVNERVNVTAVIWSKSGLPDTYLWSLKVSPAISCRNRITRNIHGSDLMHTVEKPLVSEQWSIEKLTIYLRSYIQANIYQHTIPVWIEIAVVNQGELSSW